MRKLALCYEIGTLGKKVELELSREYYNQAAQKGDQASIDKVVRYYTIRHEWSMAIKYQEMIKDSENSDNFFSNYYKLGNLNCKSWRDDRNFEHFKKAEDIYNYIIKSSSINDYAFIHNARAVNKLIKLNSYWTIVA